MHQVDHMAFNHTSLLMDLIKYLLPLFIQTPTKLQDNPSSVVLPDVSITIPDNNSVSTSCAADEIHVSSLLAQVENITTLHELHLSTVEQQCRSIMAVCENHNLQLASQLQQSQLDLQLLESKNTELTIELILLGEENQQLLKDRPVTPKLRITRSNNNAGAYKEIQITPVHIEPSFPSGLKTQLADSSECAPVTSHTPPTAEQRRGCYPARQHDGLQAPLGSTIRQDADHLQAALGC